MNGAPSEFRLLAKSGELNPTVSQSLRASGSQDGSRYQNPARAGTMDCWRGFRHAFDSQQRMACAKGPDIRCFEYFLQLQVRPIENYDEVNSTYPGRLFQRL